MLCELVLHELPINGTTAEMQLGHSGVLLWLQTRVGLLCNGNRKHDRRIGVFVVCICVYVQMRICTNVANDGTNVKDCLCSASFCEELSSVWRVWTTAARETLCKVTLVCLTGGQH